MPKVKSSGAPGAAKAKAVMSPSAKSGKKASSTKASSTKAVPAKAGAPVSGANRDAQEKARVETERKAEVARSEKTAALTGAQAVAAAVTKVADAAVAAAARTATGPLPEVTIEGVPGGRFVIRGSGFGTNGTVTVSGNQVFTRGWGATRIEGELPANVQAGDVVVHVDSETTRRGYFRP